MKSKKEMINKGIKQLKENKWIHYLSIIIIGIILSIGLNQIQIKDTHDGSLHMLRLIGTKESLEIGQFPPLINQNYCNGAGYSMNLFYPPIVTYIPLLIKIFTPTYMMALKLFGAICIILSGITMYQFSYQVTKKRSIALFSAIFYLVAPYKLANVYKRFAIGEFTAMIFIPLVFLGLYNLFNQDKKKHYYIAIGAIGLMLSHTVTTLYTVLFCIAYILFNVKKLKDKEIIKKCIINAIFILLVTMLFWMPLLEGSHYAKYAIMDNDIMRTNGNWAAANVISFSQLFKDTVEKNGTTYVIGIPTVLIILCTIFVINKVDNKYNEIYILAIIFGLISLFMVSKFFPWRMMPNLICKLQYPWRMLSFFIFFISFVCGINLNIILKMLLKKDIERLFIGFTFIVILITYSICRISNFYTKDFSQDEEYEKSILSNTKISHRQINREYMPLKAINLENTYVLEREEKTYILEGNTQIINEKKENLKDELDLKNISKGTILEFPYYYYVGYEIKIETKEAVEKLDAVESENGYLSCKIEKNIDEGKITVEYVGTTITDISYIISPISLIIFICYIIYERKNNNE